MRMRSTVARAASASPAYGFAFDVDGVLVRGPKVLPRATAALQLLRDRGVPLCFVTNGGGTTEEWRAKSLSKRLALPVSVDEVCLCHTPMQPRIDQMESELAYHKTLSEKNSQELDHAPVLVRNHPHTPSFMNCFM